MNQRCRVHLQQVALEADDHVGRPECRHRPHRRSEGQRRPGAFGVAPDRRVLEPRSLREGLGEAHSRRGEAERRRRLGEHRQAPAPSRAERPEVPLRERRELVPRALELLAAGPLDERLAAVGVVQLEDRRLREDPRRAAALRVLGIPFDLDRAAVHALDQQRGRDPPQLHRAGVELRHARRATFRPVGVGEDPLLRPAARREAAERDRGAHQLHEAAPPGGTEDLRHQRRELALDDRPEVGRFGQLVEAAPRCLAWPRPSAVLRRGLYR